MQKYVVNRPDEGAMEQALRETRGSAAEAVLRLAWQAGLLRDEIQHLTWEQVDVLDAAIVLPDRTVPIGQELLDWLQELRDSRDRSQEAVVLSDRDQKPLTPQSISRLARSALDKQGLTRVRLIDLRHDFILRQLEEHDWQYVSRITGVEAAGLIVHFAEHLEEKKISTRVRREGPVLTAPRSCQPYDRTRLSKLVRAALIRAGLDDLTLRDLRVDCALRSGGEGQILSQVRRQGWTTRNGVMSLLNVSRSTAYNRLKQLVSRGRLTQVGARYYLPESVVPPEKQEAAVLEYLEREGFTYRQDIARLLGIGASQCRPLLQRMLARGSIAQDRQRYVLKSGKAPREEAAEGAVPAVGNGGGREV